MLNNIPHEMRTYDQWIVWRLEWRKDDPRHELKPTKIPYQLSGFQASVTDPRHWNTFEEVCAYGPFVCGEPCEYGTPISETGFSGAGFVFTKSDPYCGIDLDNVHGDAEAYARQIKIFNEFKSYSELSPSGHGLHIIIKAVLPGRGRRRSSIELYDTERYFTMTGNIHLAAPITERQELTDILYDQLGGPVSTFVYGEDQAEVETDDVIVSRARSANNGNLFSDLYDGEWRTHYGPHKGHDGIGQSEADFALVDIIAFYTQNKKQIARIFLSSQLGMRYRQGGKHDVRRIGYMVDKSFDRQSPKIDQEGLLIAFDKLLDERKGNLGPESITAPGSTPGLLSGEQPRTTGLPAVQPPAGLSSFPPGLIGDVAQFIYDASPLPVREISLAGAVGFVAGITGRAYNISGTGLCVYLLLIAKTGRGKEAIASGIGKLVSAMKGSCGIANYVGPTHIASPQAISKWLTREPCCYSIIGEFGLKLKEMSSPNANANVTGLKATLLDLYNKSGKTDVLGSMAYSKKDDTTAPVASPALTIIAESSPGRFYENIDEAVILDGLLPRFMVVEYHGKRVEYNEQHKFATPSLNLVQRLAELTAHCQSLSSTGNVLEVPMSIEAKAIFTRFSRYVTDLINTDDTTETTSELWNRAHVKAMKLAAIHAVGHNYHSPMISAEQAQYATDQIYEQTSALKARFDNGEVGGGSVNAPANETKQTEFMVRVISQWACNPWEKYAKKYKVSEEMWKAKVFPYNSLHMRLLAQICFKNDRRTAGNAIKAVYQTLLDNDDLREMPKLQVQEKFGRSARCFMISNADRFVGAE